MSILQDLYESEINFSVSSFWHGGFDVKLGDISNGFRAETTVDSWKEVEDWLSAEAIKHFPQSAFAKRCGFPSDVWEAARRAWSYTTSSDPRDIQDIAQAILSERKR